MNLVERIRDAGIVGCGGAGFPTHAKLKPGLEYLIINGAECEPLLRTDRYIMKNRSAEIVRAVQAVAEALSIPRCVIAVKHHYAEEIRSLCAAISRAETPIQIHELDSFYPAGDEQTIVYEVTGRVVPPGGIPAAVGAVVDNVATMLAVSEAMDGKPFTRKILTVTGEVNHPTVVNVPIGTPYQTCIELAGGAKEKEFFVVNGGPMMGRPMTMEEAGHAVVTKTTSGILVLPRDGYHAATSEVELKNMLARARSACIQCSFCTQMCPRHMLGHPIEPHRIMRAVSAGTSVSELLNHPIIQNAQLCCECGICEVVACPMGLFPRKINAMLKRELSAAGIRPRFSEQTWTPNPMRDLRKAPSEKVAARCGVRPYYDYAIETMVTADSPVVEIPLKMHIGAPDTACVRDGETVQAGQIIAKPPEGSLGAVIHASISGQITLLKDRIRIRKD